MDFKNEYKGKNITIMGLGLHGGGAGAARFFAQQRAKVIVTDLKKESELKPSLEKLSKYKNIDYVLGRHRVEDFKKSDLIIKNPAVPNNSKHLKVARKYNVPIDTDIGIFFEHCPCSIIGITGSKGKSTTTALIAHILKYEYEDVYLAGNICVSVLDVLPNLSKSSIAVLELSSWQLEGLSSHKKSPQIAVITNIFKEHLNRYKDFAQYIEAKKIIFKYQKSKDCLIVNKNLKHIVKNAKSQITFYSGENEQAGKIVAKKFKIADKKINKAIKEFKGLPGRLQLVKEKNGIKFYNDTCATHPEAVLYSLGHFKKPVILIAGGNDKNLDFSRLNKELNLGNVKKVILLPGDASRKIKPNLAKNRVIKVKTMSQAVEQAKKTAKKGDIILLSPGATSFNLFKHEFDRGKQFEQAI